MLAHRCKYQLKCQTSLAHFLQIENISLKMENTSDIISKLKSDKRKLINDFLKVKKENQQLYYSLQEEKKENNELRAKLQQLERENIDLKKQSDEKHLMKENKKLQAKVKQLQRSSVTPKMNADADANAEGEYEVEQLLKHRTKYRKRQFLVRWKNYPPSSDSW